MNIKFYIFICFVSLCCIGCEDDFKTQSFSPDYFVVSEIEADSTAKVYLGQTKSLSDMSEFEPIVDAMVSLTVDKGEMEDLKYSGLQGEPFYKTEIVKGDEEAQYTLDIQLADKHNLYAKTSLPEKKTIEKYFIENVFYHLTTATSRYRDFSFTASFLLEKNHEYFHIIPRQIFETLNENGDPTGLAYIAELQNITNILELDGIPDYKEGFLIERSKIPGDRINLKFDSWFLPSEEKIGNTQIELRTVSKDYFAYHKTVSKQQQVRSDPFAEPIIIYNNIDGGYGTFSAYATDIKYASFPD